MVSQEQAQQILAQAQAFQQQMQSILMQKESLKLQQAEIKKAIEEIAKASDSHAYKASGPILIKVPKDEIKKELEDKSELIATRMATLERSEKRVKDKIEELREKISKE